MNYDLFLIFFCFRMAQKLLLQVFDLKFSRAILRNKPPCHLIHFDAPFLQSAEAEVKTKKPKESKLEVRSWVILGWNWDQVVNTTPIHIISNSKWEEWNLNFCLILKIVSNFSNFLNMMIPTHTTHEVGVKNSLSHLFFI